MADTDLKVIVKAKELAIHSFRLTSNCNRYPKKYRHSLVDKIQIKSLEIYETLLEANRINNVTNKFIYFTYSSYLLSFINNELVLSYSISFINRWR